MKNITVSVDEETHRSARIRAAELGTSVSALVRNYLRSLSRDSFRGAAVPQSGAATTGALRRTELDEGGCGFRSAGRGTAHGRQPDPRRVVRRSDERPQCGSLIPTCCSTRQVFRRTARIPPPNGERIKHDALNLGLDGNRFNGIGNGKAVIRQDR